MPTDRAALLQQITATSEYLKQLTGNLDDATLDFHPEPEAWNTREVLAHLVDDEMFIMRTRLERMIKEDHPTLAPHDEKHWYATRNTRRDQRDELLADFEQQRVASLGILTLLRESDWQRTAFHPEYGTFTVEGWLAIWAEHDRNHVEQIAQNIRRCHEARGSAQ